MILFLIYIYIDLYIGEVDLCDWNLRVELEEIREEEKCERGA